MVLADAPRDRCAALVAGVEDRANILVPLALMPTKNGVDLVDHVGRLLGVDQPEERGGRHVRRKHDATAEALRYQQGQRLAAAFFRRPQQNVRCHVGGVDRMGMDRIQRQRVDLRGGHDHEPAIDVYNVVEQRYTVNRLAGDLRRVRQFGDARYDWHRGSFRLDRGGARSLPLRLERFGAADMQRGWVLHAARRLKVEDENFAGGAELAKMAANVAHEVRAAGIGLAHDEQARNGGNVLARDGFHHRRPRNAEGWNAVESQRPNIALTFDNNEFTARFRGLAV